MSKKLIFQYEKNSNYSRAEYIKSHELKECIHGEIFQVKLAVKNLLKSYKVLANMDTATPEIIKQKEIIENMFIQLNDIQNIEEFNTVEDVDINNEFIDEILLDETKKLLNEKYSYENIEYCVCRDIKDILKENNICYDIICELKKYLRIINDAHNSREYKKFNYNHIITKLYRRIHDAQYQEYTNILMDCHIKMIALTLCL